MARAICRSKQHPYASCPIEVIPTRVWQCLAWASDYSMQPPREQKLSGSRLNESRLRPQAVDLPGETSDFFKLEPAALLGIGPVEGFFDADVSGRWRDVSGAWRVARLQAITSGSLSASAVSTLIRRTRSDCCARAATGHAATAPPMSATNARRLMGRPSSGLGPHITTPFAARRHEVQTQNCTGHPLQCSRPSF
jgi:hypothetical protein